MEGTRYIFGDRDSPSVVGRSVSYIASVVLIAFIAYHVDWQFIAGLKFAPLWEYRSALATAVGITLLVSGLAVLIGLAIGIALAILLQLKIGPLRWIVIAYVEIWRNTPLIVQLFWVHFALPLVTGISTTAFVSGLIAMSLQASAYLTDITRAGIQSVPRGQSEAADAVGLSASHKWFYIILPQALKIMIPALANIAIGFFKTSAILSLISVGELMSVANRISDITFRPIEVLSIAAIIYFVLGYAFSLGTYKLEKLTKA